MKILAIRGKNIASLAGAFEIDLQREPFASAGIFAICGPTGVGKSSLLDAICLALYNNTPRLNKASSTKILPDVGGETLSFQDTRNVLHQGATEGYAEVDFTGNDKKNYRVRWSVRRSRSKKDGTLQKVEMSLSSLPYDYSLVALHTKTEVVTGVKAVPEKVTQLIGLTFEQFTRTVLLAQNEFATFLKSRDEERGELLEHLTGANIYSRISEEAHNRNREENDKAKSVADKISTVTCLSDFERARLKKEIESEETTLKELEEEEKKLSNYKNWYSELDKASKQERKAYDDWEEEKLHNEESKGARQQCEHLEAIQPASSIVKAVREAEKNVDVASKEVRSAESKHSQAQKDFEDAKEKCEQSKNKFQDCQSEKNAANQDLADARSLDERIPSLHKEYCEEELEAKKHKDKLDKQESLLKQYQDDYSRAVTECRELSQWLVGKEVIAKYAKDWSRWDLIFGQAADAAGEQKTAQQKLETTQTKLDGYTQKDKDLTAEQTELKACLDDKVRILEEAQRAKEQYNRQILAKERKKAETRHSDAVGAEKAWQNLEKAVSDYKKKIEDIEQCCSDLDTAKTELERIEKELDSVEKEHDEACSNWQSAQRVYNDDVERIRDDLVTDHPCPVCGAKEHPYASENIRSDLRQKLHELEKKKEEYKKNRDNLNTQKGQQEGRIHSKSEHLNSLKKECNDLIIKKEEKQGLWNSQKLSGEAGIIPEAERSAWFGNLLASIEKQLNDISGKEEEAGRAEKNVDTAQQEYNSVKSKYEKVESEKNANNIDLAKYSQQEKADSDELSKIKQRLEESLKELDFVLSESNWQGNWSKNPQDFHKTQRDRIAEYDKKKGEYENLQKKINELLTLIRSAEESVTHYEDTQKNYEKSLREKEEEWKKAVAKRKTLLGGRPVQEVTDKLDQAVEEARKQSEKDETEWERTKDSQIKAATDLETCKRLSTARQQEKEKDGAALTEWLNRFNKEWGLLLPKPLDREMLESSLENTSQEWLKTERKRLNDQEEKVKSTESVFNNRKEEREGIEKERPTEMSRESLDARYSENKKKQNTIKEENMGRKHRIEEDDKNRKSKKDYEEEYQRQKELKEIWEKMDHLIGSKDGSKFRQYYQQLTLGCLVGYANHHLSHLSPRYRLKHQRPEKGDTLTLTVIDRDMGDEERSVYSLSGGESFLVSLALALGLASLTSEKAQIYSLFIDEGFGSLDTETLRMAMDVLDRLRDTGRQIGVISHVTEMTERIQVRIEVRSSSGGGKSTIKLPYESTIGMHKR